MTGEETHELGREGARRAKAWLEATTRAQVHWLNPEAAVKLSFDWTAGGTFSFDLGGILRGEDLDKKEFFAESKFYRNPGDQGSLYNEYLAKCYRAYELRPDRCDVFMWITWSPFSMTRWGDLRTEAMVKECVERESQRVLGSNGDAVSETHCREVSERLWLLVLSEHHEKLVPTRDHRAIVEAHIIRASEG